MTSEFNLKATIIGILTMAPIVGQVFYMPNMGKYKDSREVAQYREILTERNLSINPDIEEKIRSIENDPMVREYISDRKRYEGIRKDSEFLAGSILTLGSIHLIYEILKKRENK